MTEHTVSDAASSAHLTRTPPAPPTPQAHSADTRRRRRRREQEIVWASRVAVVAAGIAAMYVIHGLFGPLTMPAPLAVVRAGKEVFTNGVIAKALAQTLEVYFVAFGISAFCGVVPGIVIGGVRTLGRVLDPFINAFNSTPRITLVPIIIVWFGLGPEAKIVIAFLSGLLPMLINTYTGIEQADPELVEMARSCGARRSVIFRRILLPAAVPFIVAGLRIGAAMTLLGTVVAELYTAEAGLGGLLNNYGLNFEMDYYFVPVVVLAALGILVTSLIRSIENRFFAKWRTQGHE